MKREKKISSKQYIQIKSAFLADIRDISVLPIDPIVIKKSTSLERLRYSSERDTVAYRWKKTEFIAAALSRDNLLSFKKR